MIGFGAGEPDFPTPGYIVEAAVAACAENRFHKYTPAGGLPELKQAIAAKTLRDSGFEADPGQVLVTNGGKHAVYAVVRDPARPGRRGPGRGALLDHLPRGDQAGGGRPGRRA